MKDEVIEIFQTCNACPSQWEGKDAEGAYYYFRYRHGWLSASKDGFVFYREDDGSMLGVMSLDELRDRLRHKVTLPAEETRR